MLQFVSLLLFLAFFFNNFFHFCCYPINFHAFTLSAKSIFAPVQWKNPQIKQFFFLVLVIDIKIFCFFIDFCWNSNIAQIGDFFFFLHCCCYWWLFFRALWKKIRSFILSFIHQQFIVSHLCMFVLCCAV